MPHTDNFVATPKAFVKKVSDSVIDEDARTFVRAMLVEIHVRERLQGRKTNTRAESGGRMADDSFVFEGADDRICNLLMDAVRKRINAKCTSADISADAPEYKDMCKKRDMMQQVALVFLRTKEQVEKYSDSAFELYEGFVQVMKVHHEPAQFNGYDKRELIAEMRKGKNHFLLAVHSGGGDGTEKVVGMVVTHMVGSADGKRTDACYTHVFFLHENYQKAGLGQALFAAMDLSAMLRGAKFFFLFASPKSKDAVSLYKKFFFKKLEVGTKKNVHVPTMNKWVLEDIKRFHALYEGTLLGKDYINLMLEDFEKHHDEIYYKYVNERIISYFYQVARDLLSIYDSPSGSAAEGGAALATGADVLQNAFTRMQLMPVDAEARHACAVCSGEVSACNVHLAHERVKLLSRFLNTLYQMLDD
jgi:GNAT superfamily N-acetyltransferase